MIREIHSDAVTGILRKNYVNPLRAKFLMGHINMYLQLISFLHTGMTRVVSFLT